MGILIVLVLVILLTTTLKFLPSSFYPIPFSYPWRSGSEAKEKGFKARYFVVQTVFAVCKENVVSWQFELIQALSHK